MPNFLGDRLKRARIAQSLTQIELGDKLDVTGATISNWETGIVVPNQAKLSKLEEVIGKLAPHNTETENLEGPAAPPSNVFGAWLRRARSEADLSVPELAKASGLSAVAIYNIESGKSLNPQADSRARLEEALNKKIPEEVQKEAAEEQDIVGLGTLTDFDPHDEKSLPNVPGVYVFYDISERPIYIGKSDNIAKRVRDHSDKFWFKRPIVNNASYVEIRDNNMRHSVEQVLIKFLKSNAVINKQSVDR